MKIVKKKKYVITYPTDIDTIADKHNSNIDVCVNFHDEEDGFTFVVATIENLKSKELMNDKKFVSPVIRPLIVEYLSEEIVESLIEELVKNKALVEIYGKDLK